MKRSGLKAMAAQGMMAGLMALQQFVFFVTSFLAMLKLSSHDPLLEIRRELFNDRPPDVADNKHIKKKKNRKRLRTLHRALTLAASLPVIVAQGRTALGAELKAFVGRDGTLSSNQLPSTLRDQLRADLAHHPRELDGVPGLRTSVCDSGASSICKMKEEEFLPGTHTEFKSPIQLDGIAGGSEVVGKGKTPFEFVTAKV